MNIKNIFSNIFFKIIGLTIILFVLAQIFATSFQIGIGGPVESGIPLLFYSPAGFGGPMNQTYFPLVIKYPQLVFNIFYWFLISLLVIYLINKINNTKFQKHKTTISIFITYLVLCITVFFTVAHNLSVFFYFPLIIVLYFLNSLVLLFAKLSSLFF